MFVHMPPKERMAYVALVSVFVFGAGYVGAQRLRQPPKIQVDIPKNVQSQLKLPSGLGAASTAPATLGGELVVDVVGAVRAPGLQHLPSGSRVDDAVKAAGGATLDANLEDVNLAAKLEDGQQVVVPRKGDQNSVAGPAKSTAGGKHPAHAILLGSASYAELEELPGVGPSMAEKIMSYRIQHGHLSFEDLRAIPGLGPKKLEKIRPWVRG